LAREMLKKVECPPGSYGRLISLTETRGSR
jgi:hypothetical protein